MPQLLAVRVCRSDAINSEDAAGTFSVKQGFSYAETIRLTRQKCPWSRDPVRWNCSLWANNTIDIVLTATHIQIGLQKLDWGDIAAIPVNGPTEDVTLEQHRGKPVTVRLSGFNARWVVRYLQKRREQLDDVPAALEDIRGEST